MKFSLLAVGQQFEYQGETYIKSTPLIAHQVDTGEQRLIPRSAAVISDVNPPPPATEDAPVSTRGTCSRLSPSSKHCCRNSCTVMTGMPGHSRRPNEPFLFT